MKYKALVSGHIYKDEKYGKDIEILSQVDTEVGYTGIFDDISKALMDEIETGKSEDYYFMAIVEGEFVTSQGFDYTEHDIEYHVTEIKNLSDITALSPSRKDSMH